MVDEVDCSERNGDINKTTESQHADEEAPCEQAHEAKPTNPEP
jgi:hypothetical protein